MLIPPNLKASSFVCVYCKLNIQDNSNKTDLLHLRRFVNDGHKAQCKAYFKFINKKRKFKSKEDTEDDILKSDQDDCWTN